jgi:hypothetical protein
MGPRRHLIASRTALPPAHCGIPFQVGTVICTVALGAGVFALVTVVAYAQAHRSWVRSLMLGLKAQVLEWMLNRDGLHGPGLGAFACRPIATPPNVR